MASNVNARTYTANYCEENIYLLAQELTTDPDAPDAFVVFISNPSRSVLLLNQKAAQSPQGYVVWDYHVILVTVGRRPEETGDLEVLVWDFDTRLGSPCKWTDYINGTFPIGLDEGRLGNLQSMFRVVRADDFLAHFASDRSHMLSREHDLPGGQIYLSPPPSYPPISGRRAIAAGVTNNLFRSFVLMVSESFEPNSEYGRVMLADEFYRCTWLTTRAEIAE